MNQPSKGLGEIYSLTKLFSCDEILLSAWSQNSKGELLVVYVRSGDFIYYYFTKEEPIIKQIPWFPDPLHTPISIDFSPSGIFLLVLSASCHLYILPVLPILDSSLITDTCLNLNDLTIHTYPFSSKVPKTKSKSKSPNSSLSVIPSLSVQSSLSDNDRSRSSSSSNSSLSESTKNENVVKLKEILSTKCEVNPSVVCWWQCLTNSQEIGVIGTKSGDILFVDLTSGFKFGETSVKGEIKKLSLCQDTNQENVFLLITVENNEQYKMVLEQKLLNYVWCGKQNFNSSEADIDVDSPNVSSGNGNGNYLPSARARLQGLKQMSAEKLASLKHKIAETRSKIGAKQGLPEDVSGKCHGPPPENLGSVIGETMMSLQYAHDANVLAGYYAQSQLLTVHTMNLDVVPLFIHKLPLETDEILLCDRVMYLVSNHKTTLQVVSSKLTETRIDQNNDFNAESILGTWDLKNVNGGNYNNQKFVKDPKSSIAKPDLIPEDLPDETKEKIINMYKSQRKVDNFNVAKVYNLEKTEEELPDNPKMENCIVVTNRNVYVVELKSNMVKMALDLILETRELEKAEKICTVYGVNLQKLLELAGDIKLATMEFPTAMALYKLSKCGLLKSIVKLACGNHCSQVLHYSTALMANSVSDMSLTERIHLSNLILMAYTQQILKTENNRSLMDKFLDFLQTNNYFDEVLAVSVTGQSLLFSCLHKLIVHRGLILDSYNVLIKLMERFANSRVLEWSLNKNDFWECATEADLIEAMVIKSSCFPIYVEYVSQHLNDLEVEFLNKLLKVLDPTAPAVRPMAILFKKEDCFDSDDTLSVFPYGKLIEVFVLTLLFKLQKTKTGKEDYEREFLLPFPESEGGTSPALNETENFGSGDGFGDEIWPIRKDIQGNERFPKKVETVLNCGFGHTALIRNGSVYTWGQSSKGCLGHGPTMSRYASPSPVSWLGCFKLEVSVVSCGKFHTAALTNNGIYTWGCSKYGQLGLGDLRESPHPRLVTSLANENVITIECGQYHTLALTNQGSVYSWGWGVHGQLGHGTVDDQRHPKYINNLKEHFIVDIAAGHGHSLVLSDKGHVYSFGSSVFGQLGTGTTIKHSVPVLVKGISGKVINIATGYFHSLAVTESNTLYTWGSSPQCLRFQAQARKRSRLLQNQNASANSPESENSEEVKDQIPNEANGVLDKAESEQHLSPSLVDTSNVTGKIVQISCGCHHSALTTDAGGLYTWGRSIDGQLGNGGHREVQIPTQINGNGFKAECVSCGCEFTAAVEKHTGKIFCWGNNALGQLAIPVKESATKSLDGKLVMLKSCKRIVRLLDRNAGSNSIDTPREISEIPPPTFTYQTLRKHMTSATKNLSYFDPDYTQRSLHFVIENYHNLIDLSLIFKKCLEYNNFQAASKISLLQNKYKQSIIYQFKALQNLSKYHSKARPYLEKQEDSQQEEKPKENSQEIYLFTVEGGHEDLCDESRQSDYTKLEHEENTNQNDKTNAKSKCGEEESATKLRKEYIEHAKYILESYLNMSSNRMYEEIDAASILETGIQFWTAEKLPMASLEEFLLNKLDETFYDLGYLLFCTPPKDGQSVLEQFSSSFLMTITSKILDKVEKNESCVEYLETMSRILTSDESLETPALKKKRAAKKKKPKSETYIETIRNNLEHEWANENFVKISYGDVMRDCCYFFSCGHFHSAASLKEDCKVFEEINDQNISQKLLKLYEFSDNENQGDFACPSCVRNYFK